RLPVEADLHAAEITPGHQIECFAVGRNGTRTDRVRARVAGRHGAGIAADVQPAPAVKRRRKCIVAAETIIEAAAGEMITALGRHVDRRSEDSSGGPGVDESSRLSEIDVEILDLCGPVAAK